MNALTRKNRNNFLGWLQALVRCLPVCVGLGFALIPARAAERRVLSGHVPAVVGQLTPIGRVEASRPMRLAISLPWRHAEELTNLLFELQDPRSPNFRRYLSPEQFAARFGPTEREYRELQSYATAQGLKVSGTHENRMLLDVAGTAAEVERALQVRLWVYQHPTEPRTFFSADSEPSFERSMKVLDVSGLTDYQLARPKSLRRVPPHTDIPMSGGGPAKDYTAKDIRAAYAPGVTLNGAGQSVALVEFDGFYAGDITKYLQYCGLGSVPIQTVLIDGFNGVPTTGSSSGNAEVALDIEMILAMAPGVSKIMVYEADATGTANDLLARIATDNTAHQISCSWAFSTSPSAATQQIFQQMAAQGQSFFNASGDGGAFVGTVYTPDDSPYITQVGGTTLTTSGPVGRYVSETVWNDGNGNASAGGISPNFPLPSWQAGVATAANGGSTTSRNVPDVALLADNIFVVADNGTQQTLQGTSASAPLWAGLAALANQKAASLGQPPIGFVNPVLYNLGQGGAAATYFQDIKTGNNIVAGSGGNYHAVAGYDLCTGFGTPHAQVVIDALALTDPLGITPFTGFTANGPAGGPFDVLSQSVGLTNAGSGPLTWALGGLPTWLDASIAGGTLSSPGSGQKLTLSLNSMALAISSGVVSANLTFTNVGSGSVQSRVVTLRIGQSLVQNGGFETGDFAYWNLAGTSADQYSFADDGTYVTGLTPHSGSWAAGLGQNFGDTKSVGYLSQSLPTLTDQSYLLGFWLASLADTNGATVPNRFLVQWNGMTVYSVVNQPVFDWTYHQFQVGATSSSSVLKFGFTDDPADYALDDISVVPIPTPRIVSFAGTNGSFSLTWKSLAGAKYQVQASSDLGTGTWTSLGVPLTAVGDTASYSDLVTTDAQRYYRITLAQ
jgi:Pro-kumamolisin, activation domain/Subtilase family